jgi:hypothetical protein
MNAPENEPDNDDAVTPEPFYEVVVRFSDDKEDAEIIYLDPQARQPLLEESSNTGQDRSSPTTDAEK